MTQAEKTRKLDALISLQLEEMEKISDAKRALAIYEQLQKDIEAMEVDDETEQVPDPYADGDKAFDEARDNELVEEPLN